MRKRKKIVVAFLLIVMTLAILPVDAKAGTPKISKTAAVIGIGEQTKLSVSGTKKTIKWTSSNEKVASISKGTVMGKKEGKSTISAKVGGKVYKCNITVKGAGISSTSVSLIVSQKKTLKLNKVSGSVKWYSENKGVAIVDKKGRVKAIKGGKTVIKAKVGKKTYRCNLTVKSSGMNYAKTTIYEKDVLKLKVIGKSGSTKWSSSNKKIAKVDKKGNVTAVKSGKTTIKVKIGNKTYKCSITVKKPYLDKKSVSMDEGATTQIKLVGAKSKSIASSNPEVAKVNKKGIVTAVKEGTSIVSVKDTKKRNYKCKVMVNATGDINTNNIDSPYLSTSIISIIRGESYPLTLKDNQKQVNWTSDNPLVASVGADGVIAAVGAGTAIIKASIDTGEFPCTVQVVEPGDADAVLTRAEWIHLLLEKVGLKTDILGEKIIHYYNDTEGTVYEREIETAKFYGILPEIDNPEDVPAFLPNQTASREFAAMTTANALGYQYDNTQGLTYSDANQITYKGAVAVAMSNKMFVLQDNAFRPADAVTDADRVRIWNSIDEINASINNITEHSHVVYTENVIVNRLKNYTDYIITMDGNGVYHVVINNCNETAYLKAGKTAVLPANGENPGGFVVALNSDAVTTDNRVMFSGTKPADISTVITSIDYAGHGNVNSSGISAAQGVSVSYNAKGTVADANGTAKAREGQQDGVAVSGVQKGVSLGTLSFDFGEGVKIGNSGKLSGSVKVELPDITTVADIGFSPFQIKEITVQLKEKVAVSSALEFSVADSSENGNIELVRTPIVLGTTGLSADIVFYLYYDAKGGVSIEYSAEFLQGVQYKNGNFRFLGGSTNQSMEVPKLEGSAQMGLKMALNLTFFGIWELIGVDAKAGPAIAASTINHGEAGMVCVDGAIYLSLELELNPDTIGGGFLKDVCEITLSKKIFESDNSPLRLRLHFENLQRVEKCTYGEGQLEGYIYIAGTTNPLPGASVMVYQGSELKDKAFTNAQGCYKLQGLSAGYYTLKVSATGYKTFSDEEIIRKNDTTYVEVFMMVDRSNTAAGTIKGNVINAVDGSMVTAEYQVRQGWNNSTGEVLSSGKAQGNYSLDLAPGNYSLQFASDDYVTSSINVAVISGSIVIADATLSPKSIAGIDGQLRVVLTWGETPSDLDSHLFGPKANGNGRFHVYFASEEYMENDIEYADLDLDELNSYGPETVTIYNMNDMGTYSYYVHNYSNRFSMNNKEMSNSSAKVTVYVGDTIYGVYNIPANIGGTIWHVFDFDAATKTITMHNSVSYGTNVNERSRTRTLLSEDEISDFDKIQAVEEKINDSNENETENKAENEAENKTENETENKTENETANKPENETESVTGNKPENETESVTGNKPGNETESVTGNKPENETESVTGNKPGNETESESENETEEKNKIQSTETQEDLKPVEEQGEAEEGSFVPTE